MFHFNDIDVVDYEDLDRRELVLGELHDREQSRGTHLISFFFRKLKQEHVGKLRAQVAEAKNIKSKETQKIVTAGLTTLTHVCERLLDKDISWPGVVFVKDDYYVVFKLADHYNIELYFCGKAFRLDLLTERVDKTWGLIVLDTKEVCLGVFSNNRITVLDNFDVFIPSKIKAGGQSAPRFEETRKNKVRDLVEKTSQIANERFENYRIERILIGGVIPTSTTFYVNHRLAAKYRGLISEPTPTCYTNALGLEELIERNRTLYEDDLRKYYQEKEEHDYVIQYLNEKVWTPSMIGEMTILLPTKIWALAGSVNLGYYCPECCQIFPSPKICSHEQKTNLKQAAIEKYYFDSKSKFGTLLSGVGDIFYKTEVLE